MEVGLVIIMMVVIGLILFAGGRAISGGGDLPDVLRGAKLFANEALFSMRDPVVLSGKPDQVWETADGRLVVVDTKTRRTAAVYESDRIQLSLYVWLVGQSPRAQGRLVHDTAYIRRPGLFGGHYTAVDLLPPAALMEMHQTYWDIADGRRTPRTNGGPGLCHHCGHRPQCPKFNR